jgi:hypothetical protein
VSSRTVCSSIEWPQSDVNESIPRIPSKANH